MQSQFPHLLSRGYIGNMEIRNRIVMAPMGALMASPEGHVTQRTVDYYADRAKGGTGLIVVEATYPDDIASKGEDGQLGASDNSQTPGLRWLAEAIHDHYGTKCVVQLNHQGMQMCLSDRCASWGPSEMDVSWDPELKSDIQLLIDYYVGQMEKLNIKILHEEATVDKIVRGGYDAVIVATGAVSKGTKVPGHDKLHVFTELEVTGGKEKELGQTVIVVGGGVIGAEIALSQAMKGKQVILTTRRGAQMGPFEIAADDSSPNQIRIIAMLQQHNVDIHLCHTLKEITDDGILAVDWEGDTVEIKGDSVVICGGLAPNSTLYRELQDKVKKVYAIGDCVKARLIGDAVTEGWVLANQI